jgi:hypothetical protein
MLRPPMVERNYTHTCMYNCKSYSAREVSSVPSRSKEHDTTVFVCDYMRVQSSPLIKKTGILGLP